MAIPYTLMKLTAMAYAINKMIFLLKYIIELKKPYYYYNFEKNKYDYHTRQEGRADSGLVRLCVEQNFVANKYCCSCDKELSDPNEHAADTVNKGHARQIVPNNAHSITGRLTEAVSSDCNLNISVSVQEFNESLETGHVTLKTVENALRTLVLVCSCGCHLLLNVRQHHPDELHYG